MGDKEERVTLAIASPDDRRTVAAILVANDYAVRTKKEKIGKRNAIVLEFWREQEATT